jgi:hypothetical protein
MYSKAHVCSTYSVEQYSSSRKAQSTVIIAYRGPAPDVARPARQAGCALRRKLIGSEILGNASHL